MIRYLIYCWCTGMVWLTVLCFAANGYAHARDYRALLDDMHETGVDAPLVTFGDSDPDFRRHLHSENIAFLNSDPTIQKKLHNHLPGDHVIWELEQSYRRTLLVLETRAAYARLYQQYCHDAIELLLARIDMPSPYDRIVTANSSNIDTAHTLRNGITAFLVHNIVDEYNEKFCFASPQSDVPALQVHLRSRSFSGVLGSYTSTLKWGGHGPALFERDPITIWQTRATLPIDAFIVPIEETLHILLRPATEGAMLRLIDESGPNLTNTAKHIVDHWMAIEEAVVGGLVHAIMPDLLSRFIDDPAGDHLARALEARRRHHQYRYLAQGVQSVAEMGVTAAIESYQRDPESFESLLFAPAAMHR